ncbi:MAG: class I SAM-dependent methyltransferase [Verrucomicrobiae bacterium]|nr:class I SAM-dependent methyltransferase [Verrucomicrobiae bacterium]
MLAGGKLHQCRTAFLDQLPAPHNILLMGEGHGRSLVEYRRRFTDAQITCVDASRRMLTEARRQLARHRLSWSRVEFLHADILSWMPPENRHDLVATNFFLDCFRPDQLEQVVSKIAASSTRDATWLLADFQIPSAGWQSVRSRMIIWSLYRFFRATTGLPARTLTKPDPLLSKAGFQLHYRVVNEWGLLHADRWEKPAYGKQAATVRQGRNATLSTFSEQSHVAGYPFASNRIRPSQGTSR